MPLVARYLNPLWTNLQDRENATQDPMADAHLTDVSFTNLHLPESLARGIADAGFERCTPIQAQTLPRALAGFDVAGQAQTGTGKTAAFLVAMYAKLLRAEVPPTRKVNAPLALIVAPTRELAVQIHHDAEILGQIGPGQTVLEFEAALRGLEAGAIHPEPIESRYGLHVVRLDRRIEGRQMPFELVRDRIADYLEEAVHRRALRQYVTILAGRAQLTGVDFGATAGPLVQ